MMNMATILSTYLRVLLSANRFVAVCFPLVYKRFNVLRTTRIIFIALFVITCVFSLATLEVLQSVPLFGFTNSAKPGLFTKLYSVLYFLIISLIPFCLILFLNLSIIIKVWNRNKVFPQNSHKRAEKRNPQHDTNDEKASQMTRMLLGVSFAFLILTFPQSLRFFITTFVDYEQSTSRFAIYNLYLIIASKLYGVNFSINFYLYCITGSQFRKDVKALCAWK